MTLSVTSMDKWQFDSTIIKMDTLQHDLIDKSSMDTNYVQSMNESSILKNKNSIQNFQNENIYQPNGRNVIFQTPKSSKNLNLSVSSISSTKSSRSAKYSHYSENLITHPIIREAKKLFEEEKYYAVIDVLSIPLKEGTVGLNILGECAFLTGMAYRTLQNFKNSVEYLLLARKYKHPRATNALGVIFQQEGKNDQALTWYRESQQLYPSDSSSFYNAGLILAQRAKSLKESIELDFENIDVLYTENNPLKEIDDTNTSEQNNTEDQMESFEMIEQIENNSNQLNQKLIKLQKLTDASRKMFEKASRRGHMLSHFQLGMLAQFEGKHDLACIHFTKGCSKNDVHSMIYLAQIYISGEYVKKDLDLARKLLLDASSLHENQSARYLLAQLALEEGKYELAHEYFLLSATMESKYQLGLMHFEGKGCTKDINLSLKYFEECSKEALNSLYFLGKIYQIQNDNLKSLNYYENYIKKSQELKNSEVSELSQIYLKDAHKQIEILTYQPWWYRSKTYLFIGIGGALLTTFGAIGIHYWKKSSPTIQSTIQS